MGEYFLTHFNYWVVVLLMMVGLYIVFASGNMVKRLIGLGVFQTSVFLFYITLGKVAGGVPPILPMSHGAHDDHSEAHAAPDYGYSLPVEPGAPDADAPHDAPNDTGHDAGHGAAADPDGTPSETPSETPSPATEPAAAEVPHEAGADAGHDAAHGHDVAHDAAHGVDAHGHHAGEAAELLYSNPLPHVLILTAIVVGVATLAVGLALVVRIREAYGTIEDDDIDRAEFGRAEGDA